MTQEEILDYNRRCAEFLGWKQHENLNPTYFTSEKGGWWLRELEFHSDWNWIMEAVEAIEKLHFNVRMSCTCITIENAFDNDSNLKRIYKFHSIQGEFETKKEAVVQAIYEFLIWYNGQRA